jgi:hypothetical protein
MKEGTQIGLKGASLVTEDENLRGGCWGQHFGGSRILGNQKHRGKKQIKEAVRRNIFDKGVSECV